MRAVFLVKTGEKWHLCHRNSRFCSYRAVRTPKTQQSSYKLDEKFTAWYSRSDEKYSMAVHSILFAPIGNDDPRKNYQPKHSSPQPSHQALTKQPKEIELEANHNYWGFVSQLPGRSCVDVQAILSSDRDLQADLTQEAEQMQNWWRDLRDD